MTNRIYSAVALAFLLCSSGCMHANKSSEPTFTVFDVETTGLSSSKDRIVEIAAVKTSFDGSTQSKAWLINPEKSIPRIATGVHGITDEMVSQKPTFKKVFKKFRNFAGNSTLIAHNAAFDVRFINAETSRCGISPLKNKVIDSLKLFRKWYPFESSYSLANLTNSLKVRTRKLHRGLTDSEAVYSIIKMAIRDEIKKQELIKISQGNNHPALIKFD
ncbi:hypothetical protein BVX94_01670 [bacterium B17]|nr:hypothetical protein BVX94_01670 [bacterium B17]